MKKVFIAAFLLFPLFLTSCAVRTTTTSVTTYRTGVFHGPGTYYTPAFYPGSPYWGSRTVFWGTRGYWGGYHPYWRGYRGYYRYRLYY